MTPINKRNYEKKEPYRDAALYVIVCEGGRREPEYFNYFKGLSSKIKIHTIPSEEGKSAPNHLIENAYVASEKLELGGNDNLWIVLDVDRWRQHLHNLQSSCNENNWKVALSNPCFEVWLLYHFCEKKPLLDKSEKCSSWKKHMDEIQPGGFDCSRHPFLIKYAIQNSEQNFTGTGYLPDVGSTNVFRLAQMIYALVKDILIDH